MEPIFGTLQRIDHKCKEEGITGYKGLFIDYLQCSSDNFMPCVDIAGKSKIFSIVVDTLETARQVLKINSQIKGGVINIFPLETMEQMRKPVKQVPANSKSLLEIVSLTPNADPRLQILLQNIFGKVVLVRDYDEAMKVAKQNNLTCITADLDVVYAGAFISKVGHYNRAQMDKFLVYQQLVKVKAEIDGMVHKMKEIQADRDKNDISDLEAFRDLQRAEATLSQLRQAAHKLNNLEFECKSQAAHKENNLRDIEKQIQVLKQQEAGLIEQLNQTSDILKNPKKVSPQKFNEQDQSRLQQLNRNIIELTLKLKDTAAQYAQVNANLEQKHQLVNESYVPRQMQLKNMVMEVTHSMSVNNLGQLDTAAQTGLNMGMGTGDQEFSSHLQNEKAAINEQIVALDQRLRQKQEELDEQMLMTQQDGVKSQDPVLGDTQYSTGNTQQ